MIGETGERKSAVATPDGKSRKKKKKMLCYCIQWAVDTYTLDRSQLLQTASSLAPEDTRSVRSLKPCHGEITKNDALLKL